MPQLYRVRRKLKFAIQYVLIPALRGARDGVSLVMALS